jgi:hypothetical protein
MMRSLRLYHYRPVIDSFQQVACGGDAFSCAIARRVALGSDLKESVLLADFEALNMAVMVGVEGVGQAEDSRQSQNSLALTWG